MLHITIPGKLIISGEHSVVYGSPALAGAIDRYIHVELTELPITQLEFVAVDDSIPLLQLTFPEFWQQVKKLHRHYQEFLQEHRAVTAIATQIYDLPLYALGLFLQHTKMELTHGLRFTIRSDLPMGYGMGSSAAVVVGILRMANLFFKQNLRFLEFQNLAVQVENLQHGHSSGLDPTICLHEGVVLFTQQTMQPRELLAWPIYLINTGHPLSSTGEAVAHVRAQGFTQEIWDQFSAVTLMCDQALQEQDTQKLQAAIQKNHQLLCKIGVVPQRIQSFIAKLEKLGAAAKICGAGSIRGNSAGYLLVIPGHSVAAIDELAREYRFSLEQALLGVTSNRQDEFPLARTA